MRSPHGYLGHGIAAAWLLCALAGCSSGSGSPPTTPPPGRMEQVDSRVLSACTRMGLALFAEVANRDPDRNLMVSPPSVLLALSMAYNGARGETQSAMADALRLQGLSLQQVNEANALLMGSLPGMDPDVRLTLANSLWARQGVPFEADFVQRCRDSYQAEARELDFADPNAPAVINRWVSDHTAGKIPTIVDQISGGMILYLINAIYFKGAWAARFDPGQTKDGTFTLPDGTGITTPMMAQTGSYGYYQGDGFEAVHLPYGQGDVGMYLLLPDAGVGLGRFVQGLDSAAWESWMSAFRSSEVELSLPRFRFEYNVSLNEALSALGMGVAFRPDAADFSGMSPLGPYISEVRHKTFVEVNEEGTEAAAVTSVGVGVTSIPQRIHLSLDHPFLFAIRHNPTGTLLFVGSVVDPRAQP